MHAVWEGGVGGLTKGVSDAHLSILGGSEVLGPWLLLLGEVGEVAVPSLLVGPAERWAMGPEMTPICVAMAALGPREGGFQPLPQAWLGRGSCL